MTTRALTIAAAVAASLGFGAAFAQQPTTAQQVNPTPMAPGSRAGDAPGMNPGQRSAQGSPDATPNTNTPGLPAGRTAQSGTVGGTGAAAPSGQPDAMRGPAATGQTATTTPSGTGPAATGATTGNPNAQGGGSTSAAPPAATTQHTEPRTAAAPVSGANSFTEGQARSRMSDAGFNDVQELRLDDQGVWRGRAMRNGSQTGVALDYQGNVVATQ